VVPEDGEATGDLMPASLIARRGGDDRPQRGDGRPWVTDLASAYDAYWNSHSRREDQAAYHEILLFGGIDGYASGPKWRTVLVRMLRRLAHWIEAS
jgi:hypothetical protein